MLLAVPRHLTLGELLLSYSESNDHLHVYLDHL